MAAPIIGRTTCPECGFAGAHVKQSEKCVFRYCPECGSQHHCRTERQRADLVAKMRPADAAPPTPTQAPAASDPPADPPAPTSPPTQPTPTQAPKRKPSLW